MNYTNREIEYYENEIKELEKRKKYSEKEIDLVKQKNEEIKDKQNRKEPYPNIVGSYEDDIRANEFYIEIMEEINNKIKERLDRNKKIISVYYTYKDHIDKLAEAIATGLDNCDFDELMHHYNNIKDDFATELLGEYIDLQKELIRFKEEKLPSERLIEIKKYIEGKQENPETDLIDKYKQERENIIIKIGDLQKEFASLDVYGPLPEDKLKRQNEISKQIEELRTKLNDYNEIIVAYKRIVNNYDILKGIRERRNNDNNPDLDLAEQEVLEQIESDKAKLPIELLDSLNNNRQPVTREGHNRPRPKKVISSKVKKFAKEHKKLLIALGITALAASTIICFMPALMAMNSGLWLSAGASQQALLHGANMFMGKIVQVLPFIGSHNFTAAGFHTYATMLGTTTIQQVVLPAAVAGIVQAVGLGAIYNKLKSASLTFKDMNKDLKKIEKTVNEKEYNPEEIATKLNKIVYEMDIKYKEKLSEKEYYKLHDKIIDIQRIMDNHNKKDNSNNDDIVKLNNNIESEDSKTITVNTSFRFNPDAKPELFDWEYDEELTTGRGSR